MVVGRMVHRLLGKHLAPNSARLLRPRVTNTENHGNQDGSANPKRGPETIQVHHPINDHRRHGLHDRGLRGSFDALNIPSNLLDKDSMPPTPHKLRHWR